jgi:ribonuclease P protein component
VTSSRFPKTARLRKRADYLEVQGRGRRVSGTHLLLLVVSSAERTGTRVGITVTTKVGNAVTRNRLKRWIREFVRQRPELVTGDVVVIAKASAATAEHAQIDRDLGQMFSRAAGVR